MKITNFNSYNLDSFVEYLHEHDISNKNNITETEFSKMIAPVSCSFCLDNINRLQSNLLCERGYSYVHQSQRYVKFNSDVRVSVNKNIPQDLYNDGMTLLKASINIYKEFTKLKDDKVRGRLTKDDFLHGIPYEDGRYVMPLCVSTNIVITVSGDQLIDLYKLFYEYPIVMHDIMMEMNNHIHPKLRTLLMRFATYPSFSGHSMYDTEMKALYNDDNNNVYIVGHNVGTYNAAVGALASQNEQSPMEIINAWREISSIEEFDNRCDNIVNRVMSYGHKSIIEQIRNTAVMKCSLSTYHQVIRHRIHKISRENILNICKKDKFKWYIPESIHSIDTFRNIYNTLMERYQEFFDKYSKKYSPEYVSLFLPNATMICFVVNSNASNDNWIFRERLCLTAQTEIRELYEEKFLKLYEQSPLVYKHGVPPCVLKKGCKEGRMTCGRSDLQVKYNFI